jgi:glycosyltransferase involved in cell wall biosynthesis
MTEVAPSDHPIDESRIRIMFVNHTSSVSGAELSLVDLFRALPEWVEGLLACPEGELAQLARTQGIAVHTIPATEVSLRLHPIHTVVALAEATRSAARLRRLVRRSRPAAIHANSVRGGLVSVAALLGLGPPLIVHVRDLLPESAVAYLIRLITCRKSAAIIGNSRITARSFALSRSRAKLYCIYSPVDLRRFDPLVLTREAARKALRLPSSRPILGVVGQMTPWKGQDDAIRITAALRREFPDLLLLLVGEPRFTLPGTRYENRAFAERLEAMAAQLGLRQSVLFMGHRSDIPTVMRALDLLLVPSWREPFGRCVVEAMAMGTPVVASSAGGPAEIIKDSVDGFLRPPQRPDLWAEPVARLLTDAPLRERIGAAARRRAVAFSLERHASAVANVYRELLSASSITKHCPACDVRSVQLRPLVSEPAEGSGT